MDDEPALDLKKLKDSFQWQDDFRRFQNSRAELAEGSFIKPNQFKLNPESDRVKNQCTKLPDANTSSVAKRTVHAAATGGAPIRRIAPDYDPRFAYNAKRHEAQGERCREGELLDHRDESDQLKRLGCVPTPNTAGTAPNNNKSGVVLELVSEPIDKRKAPTTTTTNGAIPMNVMSNSLNKRVPESVVNKVAAPVDQPTVKPNVGSSIKPNVGPSSSSLGQTSTKSLGVASNKKSVKPKSADAEAGELLQAKMNAARDAASKKRVSVKPAEPAKPVEPPVQPKPPIVYKNIVPLGQSLLDAREAQKWDAMERKDNARIVASETMTRKLSGFRCHDCGTVTSYFPGTCKSASHKITKVDVQQRFFRCLKCSRRIATLALLPKICAVCGSIEFKRVPMFQEIDTPLPLIDGSMPMDLKTLGTAPSISNQFKGPNFNFKYRDDDSDPQVSWHAHDDQDHDESNWHEYT